MAEAAAPTLADVQKQVDEQAALVRNLKAAKGDKAEIKAAVDKLVELKAKLATLAPADEKKFDRQAFEELMKRRFFFAPSFEIYGGVAGLYDYGPIGCAIKTNMLSIWRQHFILEENMLEVDCTGLTPEPVLVTSGHVARFTDVMVKDTKTGDCLRADHLLKDVMKKFLSEPNLTSEKRAEYEKVLNAAENYTKEELHEVFQKYQVKAPATNNDLTYPVDFNMMFTTPIGPTGLIKGFLRPETAQGIFVSFKRLLEFNNGRLPFAAAQIGKSFRNEIAPRSGLLRVREFEMAEIEHFCDPENKNLAKFKSVANLTVPLYDRKSQLAGTPLVKMTLKEAVDSGLLNNETLAYFLGRIYLYLQKIGIDVQDRLRFRQHQANEMAHYACDCWDAELLTSYGWIECVGCADRSCYDLTQHAKTTNTPMYASEVLPTPIVKDIVQAVGDKGVIGKNFKKDAKLVFDYLEGLDNDQASKLEADLNAGPVKVTVDGKEFTLDKSFIKVERVQKKEFERKFVPNVIEPSFGIGRVFYSLLEQTYGVRDNDVNRGWFKLPPIVAPLKCSILPLSNNEEFLPFIDRLKDGLNREGVSSRVDDSSAGIGKKYARTDEIAIPFGVTIDFETSKTDTATVRERDSMEQVRVKIDEIPALIRDLSSGVLLWPAVVARYGLTVTGAEKDAKE